MDDQGHLHALDLAIQRAPNAPINYLLRGEYWWEVGQIDLAKADLETARDLSAAELETSDWGYILQSYLDRANALLGRLDF